MEEENKKSFSENAKSFFSAMKDDFANKNKDILDSKEKRDQELKEMNDKIKNLFNEIKEDIPDKGKELFNSMKDEFEKLNEAIEKGASGLSEKLHLEEKMKKAAEIMGQAQTVGNQKFEKFQEDLKKRLDDLDPENTVNSKVEDIHKQSQSSSIDDILDAANELNSDLEKGKKSNLDDLFK